MDRYKITDIQLSTVIGAQKKMISQIKQKIFYFVIILCIFLTAYS
jgi:hypothetical protein